MRRKLFSDERIRRMYESGRGDAMARRMARFWARVHSLGLLPTRWVTLEVPGHRSGELRRFPLGMADVDGEWFLVSMLGECAWVRNVRAAGGRVVLRRRRARACTLQEVPVEDRGPILRRYVDKVPGGRPHIPVDRGAPVARVPSRRRRLSRLRRDRRCRCGAPLMASPPNATGEATGAPTDATSVPPSHHIPGVLTR